MNAELIEFTRRALEKNAGRQDIVNALKQAGWADADIRFALKSFANIPFAVPVPRPKPSLTAHEVFIYLIMFSALYSTNFNLGSLVFEFINRAFPDPVQTQNLYGLFFDQTRWNISSLVIMLPVFLYTFYITNETIIADPTRRKSRARRWLTYITLYFATLSILGDMVSLIYNVLGGELTSRFFLKALTVAVIAGGNFVYFLWEMRREEKA